MSYHVSRQALTASLSFSTKKLSIAASDARNNDNSGLKKNAMGFLNLPASDDPTKSLDGHRLPKSAQGFNHDILGRYLCPTQLDWDDKE